MSLRIRIQRYSSAITLGLYTSILPIAATSVAATTGCGILGSPGPSAVSQGQRYQSGDPTFDEFFTNLYDMQIDLAKAPASEKDIRATLASKAKLDEGTSATMLGKKLGKRTEELAAAGTGVKMELEGLDDDDDPSAKISVKGKELEGDDKSLIEAMEAAAKSAAKLHVRMKKAKKALEQANGQIMALEQAVDTAFRKGGPKKKAEVRKNLEDAKKLIPLMQARADEVADAAKATAKKIADAAQTDTGQFDAPPPPAEPPPAEPEPDKGEKKGGEKKGGEKKGGEKKPPADKPPADKPPVDKPPADKPKPPSDFEP